MGERARWDRKGGKASQGCDLRLKPRVLTLQRSSAEQVMPQNCPNLSQEGLPSLPNPTGKPLRTKQLQLPQGSLQKDLKVLVVGNKATEAVGNEVSNTAL